MVWAMPKGPRDLRSLLEDPGFTPKRSDLGALVELWQNSEGDLEKRARTALLERKDDLLGVLQPRFASASETARVAYLRLLGRAPHTSDLRAFFVSALEEPSARVRREAIVQLGKSRATHTEEARLLKHLEQVSARTKKGAHADDVAEERALVHALGKTGGEKARAALSTHEGLSKEAGEALHRLDRTALRESDPGSIRTDATWQQCIVHFFCRPGLEPLLAEELSSLGVRIREVGTSFVAGETGGSLAHLARARIFTHLAFASTIRSRETSSLAAALGGPESHLRRLTRALTEGPLRYRLSFADGGHRRALVREVAGQVKALWPEATNDPTETLWDFSVDGEQVFAIPRGGWDKRFSYERPALPASTHPTLAAALTWLGSKQPSDIVWDPFVGAGTELRERALRGPYTTLLGTDVNESALDLAKQTLSGLGHVELSCVDACEASFTNVSLILTNPPMGRRIRMEGTKSLLVRFIGRAYAALSPGGSLVWYAPFPEALNTAAVAVGFRKKRGLAVDLGGFEVELAHFVK